jgi:hypothetical protein
MSEDRRVSRLSDVEVRNFARKARKFHGTDKRRPVNIVRCLKSEHVLTRCGVKKLIYQIVDDSEMSGKDARTDFTPEAIVISVKRSVDQEAAWGVGRARMTLSHELGHAVLHYGEPMFRGSGETGATRLSKIRPEESAEHQAKVFASAFLIEDEVAETLQSADEISTEFLVSLEAANICFSRLQREKRRREGSERVRKSNEAFQASMGKTEHTFMYGPAVRRKRISPSWR